MTASSIPPAYRPVVDRFPPALRALLDRELALGNTIASAGGGFPAPPIGEQVMLVEGLRSEPAALEGLRVRVRASSLNHLEITDDAGDFFILTPPIPPPPLPSMDEIRARRQPLPMPEPRPVPTSGESLEVDIRGEELVYHRDGRTCSVTWTYTRGHHVYRSSLTEWTGPARGERTPLLDEEREQVLARILALAASRHGITRVVLED